jgi:hypothetical protein
MVSEEIKILKLNEGIQKENLKLSKERRNKLENQWSKYL